MTNDEILEVKQDARDAANKLEVAGLTTNDIYTLINSKITVLADILLRTRWEKEQMLKRIEQFDSRFGEILRNEYSHEV